MFLNIIFATVIIILIAMIFYQNFTLRKITPIIHYKARLDQLKSDIISFQKENPRAKIDSFFIAQLAKGRLLPLDENIHIENNAWYCSSSIFEKNLTMIKFEKNTSLKNAIASIDKMNQQLDKVIFKMFPTPKKKSVSAILKKKTTFRGLNPVAEKSVLVALQRRYKVLSSSK